MLGLAMRMLGRREDAEDAVHSAVVKLFRSIYRTEDKRRADLDLGRGASLRIDTDQDIQLRSEAPMP